MAAAGTHAGVGTEKGDGPRPLGAHTANGGKKGYNITSHSCSDRRGGGRKVLSIAVLSRAIEDSRNRPDDTKKKSDVKKRERSGKERSGRRTLPSCLGSARNPPGVVQRPVQWGSEVGSEEKKERW